MAPRCERRRASFGVCASLGGIARPQTSDGSIKLEKKDSGATRWERTCSMDVHFGRCDHGNA